MNRILKILIAGDAFLWAGIGLISPILAIYIKDNLIGGSIAAVGIASMIFLLTRVTLQLIFSRIFYPKDRFWMVLFGTFFIALTPFIYLFSREVWQIFLAQLVYGFGAGLSYPAWFSLFASNLTKGKEGSEWSIYSAWVGITTGVSAFVGSWIASRLGFDFVFLLAGLLGLTGLFILFNLQKEKLGKTKRHEMFVNKHKVNY